MHLLGVLLGQEPLSLAGALEHSQPIPAGPPAIPAGLPSDLLRQRADIRRSERQLASSTAQIGVAVADLFPRFFLTGSTGLQTINLSKIADPASFFWSAGPTMTWPLFQGGAIHANIRLANARQEESLAAYQQSVLTALQEVEDALVAYAKEQAHHKALSDAVASDREALDLATKLYSHGRTDFLNVLDSQRTLYAAQDALAQSEQALSTDLVTLYKALGGGWENLESGQK